MGGGKRFYSDSPARGSRGAGAGTIPFMKMKIGPNYWDGRLEKPFKIVLRKLKLD